jgi:zinc transport system substrate-binding protein
MWRSRAGKVLNGSASYAVVFGRRVAVLAILALGLSVVPIGCAPQSQPSDRIVVAVSILPQVAFVEAVGGDQVEVVVMVPPGASPHTYELTPQQMVQLSRASLYAKVGSRVEFELTWLDRLMAANRDMLVVDCSRGIELLESDDHGHEAEDEDGEDEDGHFHSGADPHIWLSVRNSQVMVRNIHEGLVHVDPANAEYYSRNLAAYLEELVSLDGDLEESLARLENRRFIVFHPAFGYFARDYNLVQVAVEQGGNEPDAQYIVRLITEAREHDIRIVFAAPQFSLRSAEVIASEIGGKVVTIDPLAPDYVTNMRAIAEAIRGLA